MQNTINKLLTDTKELKKLIEDLHKPFSGMMYGADSHTYTETDPSKMLKIEMVDLYDTPKKLEVKCNCG